MQHRSALARLHANRLATAMSLAMTWTAMLSHQPVLGASALLQSDTIIRQMGTPRSPGMVELVEELSIGSLDGPIEYAFTRVSSIVEAPDGSVLVLDVPFGGTPVLRQFDASGRFLRSVGRAGQGPGEYVGPAGLAVLGDGRVLLLDGPTRRINVYAPDGTSLDTWPLDGYILGTAGSQLRSGPTGIVTVQARLRNQGPVTSAGGFSRTVIVRIAMDGSIVDTVSAPLLPVPDGSSVARVTRRADGTVASSMVASIAYAPIPVFDWSPLGYWVTAIPKRYAIDLRIPDASRSGSGREPVTPLAGAGLWHTSEPVVSLRRQVPPVPVGGEERDALAARLRASLDRGSGTVEGRVPQIPDRKAPFDDLRVADDGRIWVDIAAPSERYDPPPPSTSQLATGMGAGPRRSTAPPSPPLPVVPWREPAVFDVLEPDGTYLGQVAVPFDTRLISMRGDVVWGVTIDDSGVPFVKRFRIGWR